MLEPVGYEWANSVFACETKWNNHTEVKKLQWLKAYVTEIRLRSSISSRSSLHFSGFHVCEWHDAFSEHTIESSTESQNGLGWNGPLKTT